MRLIARLGTITTAGVLACGSLGAAQPSEQLSSPTVSDQTQEQTPQGSGPNNTAPTPQEPQPAQSSSTPTTTEQPSPTDPSSSPSSPTNDETSDEPKTIQCKVSSFANGVATIDIPEANEGDLVEIGDKTQTIGAQPHIKIDAEQHTTLQLTLWEGEENLYGKCNVTIPPEATPKPTNTTTSPTHDPTTDPTTPSEHPSEEPSDNGSGNSSAPEPEPIPSTEPEPVPSTTPPAPGTPPAQTAPAQPVPPPSAPSSNSNTYVPESPAPTTQPRPHSSSQTNRTPVDMRQYSDNPQYQLPQLWRTETNTGSRLIMPEPRDAGVQEPELETLPPVSDDELDAIKARLSSPDHGNRLHNDEEHVAGENDGRLTGTASWWLFSGIVGVVILGTGIWWTISRRKPKH